MFRLAITLGALALVAGAQAQVYYSTGFEPSTFTGSAGNGTSITGQDGWTVTSTTFVNQTGNIFGVSTALPKSGSQGVYIDTSPIPSSRLARKAFTYAPSAINRVLEVSSSIQIKPRALQSDPADTSGYGVFVSALVGSTQVRLAALSLFVADGTFPAEASISGRNTAGTFGGVASSLLPVTDTWYDVVLRLDFGTGQVSAKLNGQDFGVTTPFDTSLTPIAAGLSSTIIGYDRAYYDDFKIESVPEPASMAALGLGLFVFARKRKK